MKQSVMGELGNKKDTGLKRGQKTRTWGEMSAWLYLAPALAILLTFQVYPIYKSFMMGFYTRFDYLTDTVYEWGLGNFRYILCDENFRIAMKNTCVLVFFAAPLSIGSGLLFALLLNSNIRFKPFFQSVYFLPFVTSMVAVSIVWSWCLTRITVW
ncbi:sugar ABC transporter permease [Enterocloster bolteae]|uniref:carbohydrate ABC transporter permease n=1 Tax=Enterocloster bolteae TaxID=208479 RepID=UPI002A812766|nr:sugar ABC transporter permease [Enterocloster bolteae]